MFPFSMMFTLMLVPVITFFVSAGVYGIARSFQA